MNKSVLITGASQGTGFAIAERFARENYNVFITGRDIDRADAAAKKLQQRYGVCAKGYQTTAFDQNEVTAIFEDMEANGYAVDAIVLNAANLGIGQESLHVDMEDFEAVYKINVFWNFMMAREAAKQMRQ